MYNTELAVGLGRWDNVPLMLLTWSGGNCMILLTWIGGICMILLIWADGQINFGVADLA
jgi:hypothetical protein